MVELRLLTDVAMGAEAGFCQGKPAGGPVAPEGREFNVTEARRLIKLDEVLFELGHGEKNPRTRLQYLNKVKQLPPIEFPANTCVSSKARNKIN